MNPAPDISAPPVTVEGSPAEVFRYWREISNFALFLPDTDVEVLSPNELFCTARQAGKKVAPQQWHCDVRFDALNLRVLWRTHGLYPDADFAVSMEDAGNDLKRGPLTRIVGTAMLLHGDKGDTRKIFLVQLIAVVRGFRAKLSQGVLRPSAQEQLTVKHGQSLGEAFRTLSHQWRDDTARFSSPDRIFAHPAYQAIIALGEPVVPFLLSDLQREPNLWFYALGVITGDNPAEGTAGNVAQMREAWLSWGQREGYLKP